MRPRDTMLRLHRFRTEEKRRQVADIEGMINDFMRKYEESRNGVSDPTPFNYSLQAKAARARRDNLMKSIAELKDQLTDARAALDEAEQELRRAELLIEKEGAAAVAVAAQVMAAPQHVR